VTVFGAQGENCANYLSKGRPVAVEGRLDWREWEAKDGSGKRQAVSIIANSVQFLGSRDGSGGNGNGNGFTPKSDVPADTSDYQGAPAGGDDDIPSSTSPRRGTAAAFGSAPEHVAAGGSVASGPQMARSRETTSAGPRRGRRGAERMRPRKYTRINSDVVDYKDLNLLRRFLSDKGKTRGRRVTGLSRKHQRQLSVAVKRAREIALLPYVGER
jgi:ribosomal protein S18